MLRVEFTLGALWMLSLCAATFIGWRSGTLGLGVIAGLLFGPVGAALMAYEGWRDGSLKR